MPRWCVRVPLALPAVLIVLALAPASLHAGVDRWSPVAPPGGSIVELLGDPSRPATLYALTSSTGPPYKTVDGAGRWVAAGRGLSDAPVQALALDPGAPDHLVLSAGSYPGSSDDWAVFRSDDGGIGWSRVDGAPVPLLFSLAIAPAPDSALFGIGTSGPFGATFGVFRSRDRGASWHELLRADSFFYFYHLVVDLHAPRTLYLATDAGVLRSLDAGDTWTVLGRLEDGSPMGPIARVAPAGSDPAVLYASRTGDLFRSADGGETWREIPVALPNAFDCALRPLLVHPADPATLWAGCASGVAISRDGGSTWALQTVATAVRAVTALAIDPDSPQVLYAGTYDDGVFKSTSAGDGWSPASAGIREAQLGILAFDPLLPDVLYGIRSHGPCGELVISSDGGRSWSALPPASSCLEVAVLAVSPVDRSQLYLGDRHGLWVSRDGGMTWRNRYAGGVGAISIDPRRPKTVYLGGAGVVRSRDGGKTWVQVLAARSGARGRAVHQVLVDPPHPGVVYASGLDVLRGSADPFALRSTDAGATWRPLDLATAVDSFQAAPGSSGVVVAGQPLYGVSTPTEWSRTDDGGATWEVFTVPGSRLLLVPSQPYRLLTSDGDSILRSDDGGESWRAVGSWTGCNLGPGELAAASGLAPDVVFAYGCAGTLASAELIGADEIDLLGGRFGARAAWRDARGGSHPAASHPLSDQVGSFSRTDGDPPEMLIKTLDARSLDGRFWVFGAGLTRAATSLTLIDRDSDLATDFVHPAGPPASFGDFTSLPALDLSEPVAVASSRRVPALDRGVLGTLQGPGACGSNPAVLCLVDGRFRAVVTWLAPTLGGGLAAAIPLGDDAGAFWFFAESNYEVALRITAEDADPGRLRVVWGSLTTLACSLAVLDTAAGELRTFVHPPGSPTSGEDPGAFAR